MSSPVEMSTREMLAHQPIAHTVHFLVQKTSRYGGIARPFRSLVLGETASSVTYHVSVSCHTRQEPSMPLNTPIQEPMTRARGQRLADCENRRFEDHTQRTWAMHNTGGGVLCNRH
jgi:hypothetical protein